MTYNTTRRRRFSRQQREAFLTSHGGRCYYCGETILPGQKWHIEHKTARELLPDATADRDDNLAPIHESPCHKIKTKADKGIIAKSNAIRRKHGLDPDNRKPRPKMRGRTFQPGHRPLKSRNTFQKRS